MKRMETPPSDVDFTLISSDDDNSDSYSDEDSPGSESGSDGDDDDTYDALRKYFSVFHPPHMRGNLGER